VKLIPAINIIVYKLLKSYFNMNPYHKILMKHNINLKLDRPWKRRLSVKNLFISKPKIKHSNYKVNINIYVYNRKKLYYINKLAKKIKLSSKFNIQKPFFLFKKKKTRVSL